MESLSRCPVAPIGGGKGRIYSARICDQKSGQILVVTSDAEPFVVYMLDDPGVPWPPGTKCPEAVLITGDWVCFIELKGTVRGEQRAPRALDQLASGVAHFAPLGRRGEAPGHGDEHHDRWSAGQDLLSVMPDTEHMVSCVIVTFSGAARVPHQTATVAGKRVAWMATQIAGSRQEATISLADLRRKILGP